MSTPATNHIDPTAEVHPTASIWHFAVVQADAFLDAHVSVGSCAEIGRGARIGARSRIGHGVFLPTNTLLEPDVFVGPGVVFTDDKTPRAGRKDNYRAQPPVVRQGASIGAGAVILPGVEIGAGALIGAGAIVTRDVAPGEVLRCEPARSCGTVAPAHTLRNTTPTPLTRYEE